MKKMIIVCTLMLLVGINAFSQQLTVVIAPTEIIGNCISIDDANAYEYLLGNELAVKSSIKVLDRSNAMFKTILEQEDFLLSDWSSPEKVSALGRALNVNAVVLPKAFAFRNTLIISARINTLDTEINTANNMMINNITEMLDKLPAFTAEIISYLPKPPPINPFIGRWRSTILSNDQTLTCILEFRSDGSIYVVRYDTNRVSYRGRRPVNELRRGNGNGTYTYTVNGNTVVFEGALTIANVSHEFRAVNARGTWRENNPRQFRAGRDSFQCEWYVDGEGDTYEVFHKL